MSLILALASMYIVGKVVAEAGKDLTKAPARSNIREQSKNGKMDVVECFEDILKICDVKRKRHGNSSVRVLPFNAYTKCLKYIREHHLTCKADEKRFITHYKKVLSQELAQRQHQYDKHYHEVESEVKSLINTDQGEVVKFEHIDALVDYEDVKEKVDKICTSTFFGDFVINDPKVLANSSGNSFTELWALKVPVAMKFSLKQYYNACAEDVVISINHI